MKNKRGKKSIIARISTDDAQRYLGSFKTEEEAAIAYDKAAVEIAGEFANLNFKTRKHDHR